MPKTRAKKNTKITVFLHTPKGVSGINSYSHDAFVQPQHAKKVTRAFFNGTVHKVWNYLDGATKSIFNKLKIDPRDCVNGEVSVSTSALTAYAPDLL